MSVPKSKRKLSVYGRTNLAFEVNRKIEDLYWKLYNFSEGMANVGLGKAVKLSQEILDYTVRSQERHMRSLQDALEMSRYFMAAEDALNSLDVFLSDAMRNMNHLRYFQNGKERGITFNELFDISKDLDDLNRWIQSECAIVSDYISRF